MAKAVLLAVLLATSAARAQVDVRYEEEPTAGLALPATPLEGEHDARAATANPGGLALLRGSEFALGYVRDDSDVATSSGEGFGIYAATAIGGKLVPRLGLGYGLEWIRPPRTSLLPDPGTPFRLTVAWSSALGKNAGFGVAWHHFIADGAMSGVDAFDLGLSTRFGARLAIGAVVRDLSTHAIAGFEVQRRYELETLVRPLATDRLELAVGGRLGEDRHDTAGWARAAVRAGRGFWLLTQAESRDVHEVITTASGTRTADAREMRATLGVEVSFGQLGVTALGTGSRAHGDNHALGGALVARVSAVGPPSVFPERDHIERVELTGDIGLRELTHIVARLRAIARDPAVKALVVTFDGPSAGWATMEELRDEIAAVRRAHKKVFAYMVSGNGRDYFIASVADKIYIDPAGGLRVVGMAATTLYFRGALDQIGVVPQFEKIAEYKSAPEQLTETAPTAPAAKMHHELYQSLWDRWLAAVADGRHLSVARVRELVDAGPFSAGDLAKTQELVDAVAAPEKVSELVTAELGGPYPVEQPDNERPDRWSRPGIAVIYVDGDITDGESKTIPVIGQTLAGAQTLVGAIVLRIDSPGGSAVASELISREVFATRGVKPILCSMSDVAASGGYFIAAGCDEIFAEPMTITGSIGIFTGKLDISGLAKKLGITLDSYQQGKHSSLESPFKSYSDDERAAVMNELRYMYSRFVGAVSDGRKLTREKVDELGRGHVYTGEQAQPLHLVDRFGGIGDALAEAKRRMQLPPDEAVALYELPREPASLLGTLGSLLGADADARKPLSVLELPLVRALLREVPASVLVAPDTPQARLPFAISVP